MRLLRRILVALSVALALALPLAACQAPRPAPAAPIANDPTSVAARDPDVPLGKGVEILLAATADVDGVVGAESVQLRSNGQLVVGSRSIAVPIDRIGDRDYWQRAAQLDVIDLDTARGVRAVVLRTPTEGQEDPPTRHRMFVVDGDELRQVMDEIASTPHSGLRFPGDGTARYDEGAWAVCSQGNFPQLPVSIDEVILRADASGTFRESDRRPTGHTFHCNDLAACPYVYVVDGDGARKIGEVLRDVRGADAYTLQSLDLPGPTGATMTIRIAEEKPEVTYLDEVFVEIGGLRHEPRACAGASPPAYCVADLVPYVLREGDTLDLELDVAVDGPTAVFARGYYVPLGAGAGPGTGGLKQL